MYAWLWHKLPGPKPVKALEALVLLVAVTLVLFTVVFPWVEPRLPFNDVTIDQGSSGAATVPGS